MIEMQRKKSEQDLLRNAVQRNSANNLLNAAVSSANNGGLSNTAMTQIARNASGTFIFQNIFFFLLLSRCLTHHFPFLLC